MRSTLLAAAAVCAFAAPAVAGITLNPFATGQTGQPIGFVYAGNKFVGSYYFSDQLYQVSTSGGVVTPFATGVANPGFGENPLGSSLGLGGFPNRDIYVGSFNSINHVSNDGLTVSSFVTGLSGNIKGITFDSVGTFSNDMIVTTDNGSVYKINSAGSPTLVATVSGGFITEGADIAPSTFGAYAGQIVVASENANAIFAISNLGVVTQIPLVDGLGNPTSLPSAEQLSFVPLNLGASGNPIEGYYATNYPLNVYKADASQFAGLQGDAVVSAEFGSNSTVWGVHFNSGSGTFVVTTLGALPNQAEDGLFVTGAILNPGIPEPATWALMLIGVGGVGFGLRSRRTKVAAA